MEDDGGQDAKVLAVPVTKLTTLYDKVDTFRDMNELLLRQIVHFFEHYKDLEQGKWVKIVGWCDKEDAKNEILEGIKAYNAAKDKPHF
jgi:inorganic pyrophosphatase